VSSQPTDLDAALERLYAAPYQSFTEVRDALARELKSAGNAELSAQLKKERRPTVTVWALNQLARRNPEIRDTAILMISSNAHSYDVDAGLGAGADRYLQKPLSPRRLVAEMQDLITNRQPSAR